MSQSDFRAVVEAAVSYEQWLRVTGRPHETGQTVALLIAARLARLLPPWDARDLLAALQALPHPSSPLASALQNLVAGLAATSGDAPTSGQILTGLRPMTMDEPGQLVVRLEYDPANPTNSGDPAVDGPTAPAAREGVETIITSGAIGRVLREIAIERTRQIEGEGFTEEHDDRRHSARDLAAAAATYAWAASLPDNHREAIAGEDYGHAATGVWRMLWPWSTDWFKPKTRRRDLVRAAALMVAEIERLDRQAPGGGHGQ